MEAVKFIKEYRRMCKKYAYMDACGESCSSECPLYGGYCDVSYDNLEADYIVSKVEQWSYSHPQKTMIQDFFEKFPNAPRTVDGLPFPCPFECGYSKNNNCPFGKNNPSDDCSKCWFRLLEKS